MKIIYDAQAFVMQRYGGISRYIVELLKEAGQLPGVTCEVYPGLYRCELAAECGSYFRGVRRSVREFRGMMSVNRALWGCQALARRADIFHSTYYFGFSRARGSLRVLTVHDMIYEHFGFRAGAKKVITMKERAIRDADRIICVSEATRRDLIRLTGIDRAKTRVVHHGCSPLFDAEERVKRPYILYVGTRIWYKNYTQLKEVYEACPELHRNFELVCFGGGALRPDEVPRHGRIRQVTGDDEQLAELYRYAAVFAYPTRYEGFGLPLLEAFRSHCPVVTTRGGSLEEVGGEFPRYFDPEQPDELRAVLLDALNRPPSPSQLDQAARYAQQYTWKRTAHATVAVYEEMLDRAAVA